MSKSVTKDLTSGSPMRLILEFGIPILFGMLFQQCYNMVDTMIVGRFLGVDALAAVGSTGAINFMILGFCMGVTNGFAIPVAQRFGAGDKQGLRRYVTNGIWLSAIFAVVMTILVCFFCRQILVIMQTPEDIIDGAYHYIFVIFLGISATYLYNLASGIMRSLGDSKTPLYFLIFSSILNIVLDLTTIIVLKMGVAGAAWATVISQAVSGILCVIVMKKKFVILHTEKDDWQLRKQYVTNLCNIGLPMGLQYSITAIGSVILQTAVNTLGSVAVASMTAAVKLNMFITCPYEAMGSVMATYTGQNVGAGKLDRLTQGVKSCLIIGAIYSVIAIALIVPFGQTAALLFVNAKETEILGQAHLFLIIIGAFYFLLAIVNTVRFAIQGMGYSKLAIVAGVCEMAARSIVAFTLVPVFGYIGACFASPAAWLCADIFLIPAYIHCLKKLKRQMASDSNFCK